MQKPCRAEARPKPLQRCNARWLGCRLPSFRATAPVLRRLTGMPRFYFHFDDGSSRTQDPEGIVLPDAEAAWYQGVRNALEVIHAQFGSGTINPGQRFEVEDEHGEPVWAVPFEEVVGLAV